MAMYTVPIVSTGAELSSAPAVELGCFYPMENAYRPRTTAALVYVRDEGFLARMKCWETEPKADERMADGDVYKDSCLEWFINFAPENGNCYLNLEGNAAGTLHCKYGKDRYDRKALSELGVELRPRAKVRILPDHWQIDYFIPLTLIGQVFHKSSFQPGDRLRGNFYKCGDETASPHFGMWNPVKAEPLDFHRPDFFGELIIVSEGYQY